MHFFRIPKELRQFFKFQNVIWMVLFGILLLFCSFNHCFAYLAVSTHMCLHLCTLPVNLAFKVSELQIPGAF